MDVIAAAVGEVLDDHPSPLYLHPVIMCNTNPSPDNKAITLEKLN